MEMAFYWDQSKYTESTNMANTTRPLVRIHDLSDNSIVDREMNDQEYADYQQRQKDQAAAEKAAADKAAGKEALLKKLGITEEEANLLLS